MDHIRSLIIKRIDVCEIPLIRFFLDAVRLELLMTIISASYLYLVLSLFSILYKQISGSIPRGLFPGGDFPLGLYVEAFTVFIFVLMELAIYDFFEFSMQVYFQLDEWQ